MALCPTEARLRCDKRVTVESSEGGRSSAMDWQTLINRWCLCNRLLRRDLVGAVDKDAGFVKCPSGESRVRRVVYEHSTRLALALITCNSATRGVCRTIFPQTRSLSDLQH